MEPYAQLSSLQGWMKERIEERAYFLARQHPEKTPKENWFRAEYEILREPFRIKPASIIEVVDEKGSNESSGESEPDPDTGSPS